MSERDFHQGERLGPGFYAVDGELHIDLDEFIAASGGDPASERDVEVARQTVARIAAERGIEYVEVEP